MDLINLRKQIDATDDELMSIYKKRVKLINEVASIKKQSNMEIHHEGREQEILARLTTQYGNEYIQDINALYPIIMNLSKLRQARKNRVISINELISFSNKRYRGNDKKLIVAAQGVEGSFSSLASKSMFADCKICFQKSFAEVFDKVFNGQADFGVVPIENSNAGSINEVYDLLSSYKLYILKAKVLPIQHYLMALPKAKIQDIKTVCSHSQALYQCRNFIKEQGFNAFEVLNTAQAAREISRLGDHTKAAIASKETAKLYGLQILQENIQDHSHNFTRFIAVSKDNTINEEANKISLASVLSHSKGALMQLLNIIASYNINMSKLESRPIPGSNFEFLFHFDIQASIKDKNVQEMLLDIYEYSERTMFLGGYKEE